MIVFKLMVRGQNGQPGVHALRIVSHSLTETSKSSQKQEEKGEGTFNSFNLFIMSFLSDSVQIHCQLLAEPSVLRMTSLNGCHMKMLSWIHLPVRVLLIPLAKKAPMMMESHPGVQKTVS